MDKPSGHLKRYTNACRSNPDHAGLVLLHLTLLVADLPDKLRDAMAVESFRKLHEAELCDDLELSDAYKSMNGGEPEEEKPIVINDI